jgi:UDP-N-acetylmuramoyl-L-alanyl-D-glutamate--2,6-diaminopimelate ligase
VANDNAQQLFARLAADGAMIATLAADSRRCAPGVAFFAYPGERADGRAHIADAIGRGASAVLWEQQGFTWREGGRVPHAPVSGLRQQAGALAHEFYARPSHALWTCGITGTNGKTSCSHWLAALLGERGVRTGIIGTLGSGFRGALDAVANTTPDALEVHRLLAAMRKDGAGAAAMEVSSHGLAQGRVNGVRFACALFTNLSHDHLDYHRSMEEYAAAKMRLFETPGLGAAVVNTDDPVGKEIAAKAAGRGLRTIAYGFAAPARGEHLRAAAIRGATVAIDSSWGRAEVEIGALGRFNVANALGVLGCLIAKGMDFREGAQLLARLPAVPGRMERIGDAPLVVVDYAHTPDALEKVLGALRPVAEQRGGKLAAVFGAGGDRDASKRPVMGAVAAKLADRVLVTSDNPRGEDPLEIIRQIGVGPGEPDRARAIRQAIAESDARDVVLIAGKGHEDYQEIAGKRLPFSDAAVARAALAERGEK